MATQRKSRQAKRNFAPPSLTPKTATQAVLLETLTRSASVIAIGPAGTGKTYLATSFAASQLTSRRIGNIIVARPLVGVGQTAGLLPGSLKRKLDPWARPITAALKEHMGERHWEEAEANSSIEVTSLEHIRGLTYDDSIMIIDEAQNTTPREMKAFLTRIGQGSRVIICGDITQSDLSGENGLQWCLKAADKGWAPSTQVVEFSTADIVRSELCKEWQIAFDKIRMESTGA